MGGITITENDTKRDIALAEKIAEKARSAGGRVFYVGGCVRDKLLYGGELRGDIDIEVHGVEPAVLWDALDSLGEPLQYGSSFGIYGLSGSALDIAIPRKEHATGRGHRDFEVFTDPFIGAEAAARRRDFTVNALMEDVLTGEIVDPYGGREDLEKRVLRCVDPASFIEDPLRVLRCARFAAVLGFSVDPATVELCSGMDLATLSRERVEGELKKALMGSEKPSVFFETLRRMRQLSPWFAELEQTVGLEQDPEYHPEGDVWTHTMEVLDRAAGYRGKAEQPYPFMMLALTHDLGKITTTEFVKGRIHAYGHESAGLPIIEGFLRRLTDEAALTGYVLNMAELHMKPNMMAFNKSPVKSTNKMFDQAASAQDLIYMAMSDHPVKSGDTPFSGDAGFLFERLERYRETMAQPYVMGRDLIAAGLEPGENFGELLEYAHKLRLAGIDKQTALKQVLAMARKK
ncbi:MAG: tRNA nucleotidyltransferase [Firmicutes bacterium]|nr:tRNA nucleotidyltransferase [Bacillota bacterium]